MHNASNPYGIFTKKELEMMNGEQVDHPSHYGGDTTYETIKVIEAWKLNFHLGNAVKYISRAGYKLGTNEKEDIQKAIWYLQRWIKSKEKKKC